MVKTLSRIMSPGNIVLGLDVPDKQQLFEQVGVFFERTCDISQLLVTEGLLARESVGSTGLGYGVAIPHGRIDGLENPCAAFFRLANPVPFESPDSLPVTLLFILLIPQNVTQQHLEILSEIAALFSDSQCREVLANETDKERIYNIIANWKPGQPFPT